jgi:putative ABC transport system substrate-binding protein
MTLKRRDFITFLGGAAAIPLAPPLAAHAQQADRMRRIAVLMLYAENDPEGQVRATAFRQGIEGAGWAPGRNIAIDYLWGVFDNDWTRMVTTLLQRLAPDVIVANGSSGLPAAESAAPTVPIVFVGVTEPVARGLVASLARPGGNMTGFSNLEETLGAKWLDLLKEIAPQTRRVAFLVHASNSGYRGQLQSAQSAAQKFSVEVIEAQVRDLAEIEATITMLARESGGALVVPPDPFSASYRKQITELAVRNWLPLVCGLRSFADEGGLLTYGAYIPEMFRQAAGYVDRILKGEKPADLPVQAPVKYELAINLKTAKALGLNVPPTLLALADEVIE